MQEKAVGFIKILVQDGIPIFFYISGLACSFYNTEKNGFSRFAWGKVKRLMIPWAFAMIFILIPRLYLA